MAISKLEKIAKKYSQTTFNSDNFAIGGGLDQDAFASRRHQEAKYDSGKLTFGEVCQSFKKATELELDRVKAIIQFVVPNMEWHHAGKLPKSFGGGMKKTYFLNAVQICDLALNWAKYTDMYDDERKKSKTVFDHSKQLHAVRQEFLKSNANYVSRVSFIPQFFYEVDREMKGKNGWFCSYGKSYKLPEYYSGWVFESEKKYQEFLSIN